MKPHCFCRQLQICKIIRRKAGEYLAEVGSFQQWRAVHLNPASYAKDHYSTLDVPRNATPADIKAAYFKLSKMYHPDKNKSSDAQERFTEIGSAYEVIGNTLQRKEYDKTLPPPQFYSTKQTVARSRQSYPYGLPRHRQHDGPVDTSRHSGRSFNRKRYNVSKGPNMPYEEVWRGVQNERMRRGEESKQKYKATEKRLGVKSYLYLFFFFWYFTVLGLVSLRSRNISKNKNNNPDGLYRKGFGMRHAKYQSLNSEGINLNSLHERKKKRKKKNSQIDNKVE